MTPRQKAEEKTAKIINFISFYLDDNNHNYSQNIIKKVIIKTLEPLYQRIEELESLIFSSESDSALHKNQAERIKELEEKNRELEKHE